MSAPWNHNIHYHDLVLRAVPAQCRRALDVGRGAGLLTRRLAPYCGDVVGIDTDRDAVAQARAASAGCGSIEFIEGDAMAHPFAESSFDFIAVVAALHHLPLRPALTRFRALLRPGGVIAILGLYRAESFQDHVCAAAALPASLTLRLLRGHADVGAPLKEPEETIREIRAAAGSILPGCAFRRCLLFRYSLTWRKA